MGKDFLIDLLIFILDFVLSFFFYQLNSDYVSLLFNIILCLLLSLGINLLMTEGLGPLEFPCPCLCPCCFCFSHQQKVHQLGGAPIFSCPHLYLKLIIWRIVSFTWDNLHFTVKPVLSFVQKQSGFLFRKEQKKRILSWNMKTHYQVGYGFFIRLFLKYDQFFMRRMF